MIEARGAGILLHPTSLPGPFAAGDVGPHACAFADALAFAKQRWWQMLPVVPAGAGNSPYSSASAFAGSELMVSPEWLHEDGLLEKGALVSAERPSVRTDYDAARAVRGRLLSLAFEAFERTSSKALTDSFRRFVAGNESWLGDWSLFRALKDAHGGKSWVEWDAPLRDREPRALGEARKKLARETRFHEFVQWCFDRHWSRFREHARWRGVHLIGDVPIFVEHDSADVWANRELFQLDAQGRRKQVAGVPPDYFSATGQLWGNPLYRWDELAKSRYAWWVRRLERALTRFDLLRVDHFIGFHRAWALPASAKDATNGKWQKGPGEAFFSTLRKKLDGGPGGRRPPGGERAASAKREQPRNGLPLIAEDLGLVIPEVKALRDRFELPGMKVLQFAFGDDAEADAYKPHNHVVNSVVYTGTHDNDTTVGWFEDRGGTASTRKPEQVERERAFALRYLASDGREIHWDMIRAAYASVARTAIVPLQDVLGLGSAHRMNVPGVATGNWEWRFESVPQAAWERLGSLAELYGRTPEPVRQIAEARA